MKILQWGFIGCGDVVERKSGPAFGMVEGSCVVAVMSRSAEKARELQASMAEELAGLF